MENCIFCKIISRDISSVKIRENDDFMAILDVFPNREGMTLVISKKHFQSDIFSLDDDFLQKYIIATKFVISLLKKGFNVEKVGVVIEGLQVDHAHIKLYPFHQNHGFVDGLSAGEKHSIEDLQKVANKIFTNNI